MVGFAFRETDEAAAEITRLFNFVWPTAVALWNLRWQVDGFLSAVPDASYEDVASRFVVGSDIHGADIRAMSLNTTWDEQKARFAEFILTNVFAIYEGWAKRLLKFTQITGVSDRDLYRLGDRVSNGLFVFIAGVNATPSVVMQRAFQPSFLAHRKVYEPQLENMLKCYKYFKEIRNCQIHNGGIADQKSVDAFTEFLPVSSAASLKTKGVIEFFPAVLGQKQWLSLRGVVGFCDVVLRMMVTVDALISGSEAAERSALQRVRSVIQGPLRVLNSNKSRAEGQIKSMCRRASLPIPAAIDDVRQLFLRHRLVSL